MHCSDVYDDSADWVIPVSAGQTVPAISAGVLIYPGINFHNPKFSGYAGCSNAHVMFGFEYDPMFYQASSTEYVEI